MNNLEKIVPVLALCKRIPAGEFEESELVWHYAEEVGFVCRISGYEQIRKKVWKVVQNYPGKIARFRKYGEEIYPAPTLEEICLVLRNLSATILDNKRIVACKIDPEIWIEEKAKNNDITSAALQMWLKMKEIEVR